MNAEQYRAVIRWFNARPVAKMALRVVSRGAVALVMGLDRAMKNLNGGDSIYNHRGLIIL